MTRLRRSRERNLGHDATTVRSNNVLAKLVLVEIFDARCVICGGFLGAPAGTREAEVEELIRSAGAVTLPVGAINLDHMNPASHGGPDHILNYAPAHERCNKARGKRSATAEHQARFDAVWLNFESNGHDQILSRMIVAAREIEIDPARFIHHGRGTEDERRAVAADLAGDLFALRLTVRPCSRGHTFHVYPEDPDFCVSRGVDHDCGFYSCRWFSQADSCWLEAGMKRRTSYPFTIFFEVTGGHHTVEVARFLEAFIPFD